MLEINKIHCGDCLELMKEIPDKSIDCVITDPPYGVGKDFANDDNGTPINLLRELFNECFRVCRDDSFMIFDWSRQKVFETEEFIGKWDYLDLLAVTQENTMAFCRVGFDVFQIKLLLGKGKPKVVKRGWNLYKTSRKAKLGKRFVHPTMKQIDVYEKVIIQFTKDGDTILDPFIGSGTTAIACWNIKRDFIGIEINQEYVDIANNRLEQAFKQEELICLN